MFKRKKDVEVVPESEYTDFSGRYEEKSKKINSTIVTVATGATASLATYTITKIKNPNIPTNNPTNISTTYTPPEPTTLDEPFNVLNEPSTLPVDFSASTDVLQTGVIADTSLNMLAAILDPVIQILVAISFPIASVIMVGACFFFMIGNSEKAWSTIMNAGLGYVLIQMSPLFLKILQEIGKAI